MVHFGHQTIMAIDRELAKNYPYKLAINDPALTSSHHSLLYLKHSFSSQRMHTNPPTNLHLLSNGKLSKKFNSPFMTLSGQSFNLFGRCLACTFPNGCLHSTQDVGYEQLNFGYPPTVNNWVQRAVSIQSKTEQNQH